MPPAWISGAWGETKQPWANTTTSALLTHQLSAAQSCPEQARLAWWSPSPASFPQVISQPVAVPGDLHLEHTPWGEQRPRGLSLPRRHIQELDAAWDEGSSTSCLELRDGIALQSSPAPCLSNLANLTLQSQYRNQNWSLKYTPWSCFWKELKMQIWGRKY